MAQFCALRPRLTICHALHRQTCQIGAYPPPSDTEWQMRSTPHHHLPEALADWTSQSWPAVLWPLNSPKRLTFSHLHTRILRAGRQAKPRSRGHTFWCCADHEHPVGLGWDWEVLGSSAIAIVDPLAIVTNLRLLHPDGHLLMSKQSAPFLNTLVHELPWQIEAARVVGPTFYNQFANPA